MTARLYRTSVAVFAAVWLAAPFFLGLGTTDAQLANVNNGSSPEIMNITSTPSSNLTNSTGKRAEYLFVLISFFITCSVSKCHTMWNTGTYKGSKRSFSCSQIVQVNVHQNPSELSD
ncbi:hypothetical protein ElyMa_001581900 [Elysia marginata]|uniref:Uncharacterized protein n=1 Tax=Elysia marginata TaxID=1093978 RepID=A0AAV4JIP2_9GAST|nr:hypothetical protein ElyMa_001581900 [Elysia marginata]